FHFSFISVCAFSKHGCCKDYKTFAEGKEGRSCEMKLCIDKHVSYCLKHKNRGTLDCKNEDSSDSENCPFSCGQCKAPAPPIKKCLKTNPIHGCCWDGTTPLGQNGRGCRPCRNNYPKVCETFRYVGGGCNSGSYGIRTFMTENCPVSCGFCEVGLPVEGPTLKMRFGRSILRLWLQIANWVLQRMRPVPAAKIITEGSNHMAYQDETSHIVLFLHKPL
ncbi:hypothetical protein QZH41_019736, partial [Actinostola sp. cb2023]